MTSDKPTAPAIVYLSLGSNLGDREGYLRRALELLVLDVTVQKVSAVFETAPVGYLEQGPFLNAVVAAETTLSPIDLLARAKDVERQLGREPTARNGPRVIDVDILSYANLVVKSDELELPHPRIGERAFVLVPLAEIAPEWRHPVSGRNAAALLAALGEIAGVRCYQDRWWTR